MNLGYNESDRTVDSDGWLHPFPPGGFWAIVNLEDALNARRISHVTLRDYLTPEPDGWAMLLARGGYAAVRTYLRNPRNLHDDVHELLNALKERYPGAYIHLEEDNRWLLYYNWRHYIRIPRRRRHKPKKAVNA